MGRSMDNLAMITGNINPLQFHKPIEILFSSEVNAIAESEEEAISKTKMFNLNYKLIVNQSIQVVNKMYKNNPIQSYSIVEMNDILISTSVELEKLENIVDKLAIDKDTDSDQMTNLVLMSSEIGNFRRKFRIINKNTFDKKFNIVELAKKNNDLK